MRMQGRGACKGQQNNMKYLNIMLCILILSITRIDNY